MLDKIKARFTKKEEVKEELSPAVKALDTQLEYLMSYAQDATEVEEILSLLERRERLVAKKQPKEAAVVNARERINPNTVITVIGNIVVGIGGVILITKYEELNNMTSKAFQCITSSFRK